MQIKLYKHVMPLIVVCFIAAIPTISWCGLPSAPGMIVEDMLLKGIEKLIAIEQLKQLGATQGKKYVNEVYREKENEIKAYYRRQLDAVTRYYDAKIKNLTPKAMKNNKDVQDFNRSVAEIHKNEAKSMNKLKRQKQEMLDYFMPYWNRIDKDSKMF